MSKPELEDKLKRIDYLLIKLAKDLAEIEEIEKEIEEIKNKNL